MYSRFSAAVRFSAPPLGTRFRGPACRPCVRVPRSSLRTHDRIKIAADWAAKFGAVLIGVAGWLPGRQVGGWFAAELERPEDRIDRIMAELEKLAEHFRNLAGRAVRSMEWRGSFHFPREVIAREARPLTLWLSAHIPSQKMFIKRLIPEPCCSAPADQFSLCPTG